MPETSIFRNDDRGREDTQVAVVFFHLVPGDGYGHGLGLLPPKI